MWIRRFQSVEIDMLRFMEYLHFYGFSKVKDLLRTSVV